MSYINEALKKAQRDRDSRYQRFEGIIASGPAGTKRSAKRKLVIGSSIGLIVLISAGLVMALYFRQSPTPAQKGSSPSVVSESPETKSVRLPEEKDPVITPPATTDNSAQGEKTGILPGEAPTRVDGKRSPSAAVTSVGTPRPREVEDRYREALTAQRRGDHQRAETLYQQTLLLDPGHIAALNNLGVLYMDQKKKREAVALFNRAIGLKKDYVDPYYNLACVYARVDEIDESLKYLKMAMAINKDVKNWAERDADMKAVVTTDEFKKIVEGQRH
jgi:tetratricopeptide (TPR) repeat protein